MNQRLSGELQELTGETILNGLDVRRKPVNLRNRLKKHTLRLCSSKILKKRLPCLAWIPEYHLSYLLGDCIAGLTVSLLTIPQALAYGLVAGLPPNYGLYSAFVCGIIYFFLGSTKELNIGPTAIMSLMTYQYSSQGGTDYAVLLCFLSGVIEIFAGIINLGFFITFISQPVISGFTSAAAIAIASSQVKGLIGLKNLRTEGVVDTWYKIFLHIKDSAWQDIVLGLSCIVLLTAIKFIHTSYNSVREKNPRKSRLYMKQILFYLNVGRNALIVFVASLIAYYMDGKDQPFTLTGSVEAGIPSPQLPPFSTTIGNKTMSFHENIKEIGLGVAMIPFLAILYDVAVASAFTKGRSFDVTQEIITLGIINLIGSFFRSMPTTACLSRTAVNVTSGVRTPAAGLLTGIIVLIALAVLTPYFRYIPKASLSAVIICAVMYMFDYDIIRPLWRTKKIDLVHLLVTFFACLFMGLEWGILLGIAVNLVFMLFKIATPTVKVSLATFPQSNYPFVLVSATNGMLYPSVMHIRTVILKAGLKEGNGILPVVVDCSHIVDFDYTSSKALAVTMEAYTKREQPLILLNLKPKFLTMVKSIRDGVSSYDSLEDVEKMLYNFPKITRKIERNIELSDEEDSQSSNDC